MTRRQFYRFVIGLKKIPDYPQESVVVEYRCNWYRGGSDGLRYLSGNLLDYNVGNDKLYFWDEDQNKERRLSYRSIKSINFC